MTTLQLLAQAAVFATFLGVFIALVAYFNGKHIKENATKTNELIEKNTARTNELIGKNSVETNEILRRIDETLKRMGIFLEKMDERAEQRQREVLAKL